MSSLDMSPKIGADGEASGIVAVFPNARKRTLRARSGYLLE